jgi:RimJ/RimL family protein N-acetyltransferase
LKLVTDAQVIREYASNPQLEEYFRGQQPHWTMNDAQLLSAGATYEVLVEGKGAGLVALSNFDHVARRADLGAAILPCKERGRIAVEACRQVAAYFFDSLGYHKLSCRYLESRVDLTNLLARFGFETEGLLRQHTYWKGAYHDEILKSLTRADWQNLRKEP